MSTSRRREINERVTAVIIHGFTIAHVIAAGVAGPLAGPILSPMTATMVIAIGSQCCADFSVKNVMKLMANFVGFILGVSIAEFIVGLFPGIGNIANAIASGVVTELLGWATFLILREGMDERGKMSLFDQFQLLRAAAKIRKENSAFMQKLKNTRRMMSQEERDEYDELMKTIASKDVSKSERADALYKADAILKKYGISIGLVT